MKFSHHIYFFNFKVHKICEIYMQEKYYQIHVRQISHPLVIDYFTVLW